MVRQARRAATLVPGASLRGVVFDACFDNRIPNTFGMLQHFGMPNRNRVLLSESPHLDTSGLAAALRIDETEVLSRRYPAHGRGHCTFFGLHVLKGRIEDRVRRFSPAAIADGVLHHPATHELRDLPFSTVGWDILQDTCPCTDKGVRQNWVTVNGSSRCQSCGGDLGRIAATPVPDYLRPSLKFIAGLVDPDPAAQEEALGMLPAAIRETDRTLLYDLVMNLARAGSDGDGAMERTAAIARACEAILQWPTGVADFIPSGDCMQHLWSWIRRTYAVLDVTGSRRRHSATAPTEASGGQTSRYAPSGSVGRISTDFIGAMAAARLGGVDEQGLKQAWDDGRFTQHVWVQGSRRIRAFDPAEVVAVAPTLRLAGTRATAARRLGLPGYGLEQLLEADIFSPAAPGNGLKQKEAHLNAARALEAEIERAVSAADGRTTTFLDAIRHVSGRRKPWAAAIAALLDGSIPFRLGTGPVRDGIAGRIVVSQNAIPVICSMSEHSTPKVVIQRADRWTGADSLECLNGYRQATELLDGLTSSGTRNKRLFAVADVIERAETGVTTYDLTRRSGLATTHIVAVLDSHGVGQIAPGLWERQTAERLILPVGWQRETDWEGRHGKPSAER